MTKAIWILKALGIVLGLLIAAWVVVIFLVAMGIELAGDLERKWS